MSESKPSISFNFSSKRKNDVVKLPQSNLLGNSQNKKEETDFINAVENNKINGSIKAPPKKELVIPLISKNKWRIPEPSTLNIKQEKLEDHELEQQAATEILEETSKAVDSWEQRNNGVPSNIAIPLFMQNRVPSGYETEDKVDVSLRAEQSTLDDYEAIPVEAYGMAMLRGMGWKASEGIGLSHKGVAPILEVKLRPKGLGLGADRSMLEKATKTSTESKDGEEKLKIVVGAYVQLLGGKNQGSYGQILSMDPNTGRVLVKLAVGNKEVEISELFLKPVSAKAYKDSSRFINNDKYNEYKMKQEEERKDKERHDRDDRSSRRKRKHSPNYENDRKDNRDRSRDRQQKHETKDSRSKKHSKESKESDGKKEPWLHPFLRVRCIDSHFKDGQYYKQKLVVLDVVSKKHCICKAESGKLLENVSISKLETVIPRGDPAYVMVVRGKRKGQVGEVIERDKDRCVATVQILPDRDDVFRIDYDDICEFTGDVRNL